MTDGPSPLGSGPAPTAAAWAVLPADSWATVLVLVRELLGSGEDLTDGARAVRERPTSRLVAGRGRQAVVDLLVADPALAAGVLDRLDPPVRDAMTGVVAIEPAATAAPGSDGTQERLRARVRRLRDERDAWQRRATGAEARVGRLEQDLAALREDVVTGEARVLDLQRSLAQAGEDRDRAVQRERRRRDAEVARLEAQLAELRRAEEDRRTTARRRAEQARRASERPEPAEAAEPVARLAPGRPTRLPRHVEPDTTEAARLLLGPGRRVLVDGYNVTRTHRDDLDLEGQRSWLVQRCVTAAAALRLRPVVVFDGQRGGASRPTAARQQVEVRFTPAGITADDELVLEVEATDEPVVVVTDDRELRDRVRAADADVVGTLAFLGVVGR